MTLLLRLRPHTRENYRVSQAKHITKQEAGLPISHIKILFSITTPQYKPYNIHTQDEAIGKHMQSLDHTSNSHQFISLRESTALI